jgi:hypothetical protein
LLTGFVVDLFSLNHSFAAEMIRRCNSQSAALPFAFDLDPALDLDWGQKQDQDQDQEEEADFDLRLFSEENGRFSEF